MARATYTPNAPLLLTNIQYNHTISDVLQLAHIAQIVLEL